MIWYIISTEAYQKYIFHLRIHHALPAHRNICNSSIEMDAQIEACRAVCETEIVWRWLWGRLPAVQIGSSLLENQYEVLGQ